MGTCLETIPPRFLLSIFLPVNTQTFLFRLIICHRTWERIQRYQVGWKITSFRGKCNVTGCCVQKYALSSASLIVWLFNCAWLVTIITTDKLEWSIFRWMNATTRKHQRNSADVWMLALLPDAPSAHQFSSRRRAAAGDTARWLLRCNVARSNGDMVLFPCYRSGKECRHRSTGGGGCSCRGLSGAVTLSRPLVTVDPRSD